MTSTKNYDGRKRTLVENAQKDVKETLTQPNNTRIDINRLSMAGRAKQVRHLKQKHSQTLLIN